MHFFNVKTCPGRLIHSIEQSVCNPGFDRFSEQQKNNITTLLKNRVGNVTILTVFQMLLHLYELSKTKSDT